MGKLPNKLGIRVFSDPTIIRVHSQERLQQGFEPYAIELGLLVHCWNRLQSRLAELFSDIVGTQSSTMPKAIWYAVPVDRTQRQMLLAGAIAAQISDRAKEDIKWIVDRAEEFEDRRNNAIHAPLTFMTDQHGTTLVSAWYTGHPRAKKLKDKELMNEFKWYGETAAVLAAFAQDIHLSLKQTSRPWPDRPPLPQLQRTTTLKEKSPQTKKK